MTRPRLQVNLKTYQRKWQIDPGFVRNYLGKVWSKLYAGAKTSGRIRQMLRMSAQSAEEKIVPVEITVVLLNDSQIRRYNREFRKKNEPTDVLSFPVHQMQDEISSGKRRSLFYLGDMLISMERAAAQAREKKHTTGKEFKILLLHGFLHLLGYDHETDSGQMERLEYRLREALL